MFSSMIRGPVASPVASLEQIQPLYLRGNIVLADCVAAYQPKGAASYAASLINLAHPGTNNASANLNVPGWSATLGWIFDGTANKFFDTGPGLDKGIKPQNGWSAIVKFSNIINPVAQTAMGNWWGSPGNTWFAMHPVWNSTRRRYQYGGNSTEILNSFIDHGVMAITPDGGYFNGALEWQRTSPTWPSAPGSIIIGSSQNNGHMNGNVEYLFVYNIGLTADDVRGLTNVLLAH